MEKAQGACQLIASQRQGILCTNSLRHPGYPFGSVTPYALDDHGQPIFLFSSMAVHTKNLVADRRVALMVTAESSEGGLLAGSRANFMGTVAPLPDSEKNAATAAYLALHPEAEQWVNFGDFRFYRMDVAEIYYVAGFGVMGWISSADYANAASR